MQIHRLFKSSLFGILASGLLSAAANAAPKTVPTSSQSSPQKSSPVTPAPESQFIPKARINLTSDRVNVTLKNNTYATIAYQAIGDTQPRTLAGRQSVTLRGLKSPTTITLDRQDAGLLLVQPTASTTASDTLEVTLDTTTDLAIDATTLRIERSGSVFLY